MNKFTLLLSMLIFLFFAGCGSHTHEEAHKEETVFVVTKPVVKDTMTKKDYVCQIHSIQHIEIRALEKGYLQEIFVDEGQMIKEGQLMFRIMPLMYQAEMQKAQAELQIEQAEYEYAEIDYKNTKALADSNIVSTTELALSRAKMNQAKARLDQAKAKLALADVHLKFTEIKAPFTGIMDRFQVRLGSLVSEGDMLTSLSDNSKVWVYFNVSEAEYLNYKMATPKNEKSVVELKMANNMMFNQRGIVETIEADFNSETGNIPFRATFPNPDGLLRHGETGNVVMTVPHKNAIIIPQKATFEVLEKRYAFVVGKDSIAKQVEIEIASEMPDLYVIGKGLSADDKILLEGIRKVKDGQKIAYTYADPVKVLAELKVYVE